MWRYYIVGVSSNKIYAMARSMGEARRLKEDVEIFHHIRTKIVDTKENLLYATQFSGTVNTGRF